MTKVEPSSYLSTHPRMQVHITPYGAKIVIPPVNNEPRSESNLWPVAEVNKAARDLLLRCDGISTLADVLSLAENRQDSGGFANDCILFLEQAIQYGFISASQVPVPTQIATTGSTDFIVPQHINIELTSNCNLKCIYCYRDAGPHAATYLPVEQLLDIIEQFVQYGTRVIELTGGEPLLYPEFSQVVDFCAQHGSLVSVLSNGCLINEQVAKQLAEFRDRIFVQVDIDGSTASKHDYIRGVPGAFQQTTQCVALLAQHQVRTHVVMNVIPDTLDDVENTLCLAQELGATWFNFAPVLSVGRANHLKLEYSLDQVKYMSELPFYLGNKYESFYRQLTKEQLARLTGSHTNNCGAGTRSVVLGPTGKIRPCLVLPEEYLVIGDATKQSVADILSSPVLPFLHELRSPGTDACKGCIQEMFCRYCYTRGLLAQAKFESPCPWAKDNLVAEWFSLDHVSSEGINATYSGLCQWKPS